MSQIRDVDTQGVASPIEGLTMVAVLCEAPDGWRVYEAALALRVDNWDEELAVAVAWTHAHGNKLSPSRAKRYFALPFTMKMAP